MSDKTLFFGGIPTAADVRRLSDRWPLDSLKPGVTIPYLEISKTIGSDKDSNRWASVTSAWRKKLEADGVYFATPDGTSFKVMTEADKADLARQKLRESGRRARKALTVAARVDRKQLENHQTEMLDNVEKTASAVIISAQLRKKPQLPEL